jgi:hypothetical protein
MRAIFHRPASLSERAGTAESGLRLETKTQLIVARFAANFRPVSVEKLAVL